MWFDFLQACVGDLEIGVRGWGENDDGSVDLIGDRGSIVVIVFGEWGCMVEIATVFDFCMCLSQAEFFMRIKYIIFSLNFSH